MSYNTTIGGDYLEGTFGTGFDPSTGATIVAWFKNTAAQHAQTDYQQAVGISDNNTDNNNCIGIGHMTGADSYGATIVDSGGGQNTTSYSFADTTYDDTWVVVVGRYISDTSRFAYVESSSQASSENTTTRNVATIDYIRVGDRHWNTSDSFQGLISHVAIFDKALSTAEIDALQTGAETGPAPNTVASADCIGYWSLEAGSEPADWPDESGNGGPTLSIVGSPPFTTGDDGLTITGGGTNETIIGGGTGRGILRGHMRGIG